MVKLGRAYVFAVFIRVRVCSLGVAEFKRVCVGATPVIIVVAGIIWFRAGSPGRA